MQLKRTTITLALAVCSLGAADQKIIATGEPNMVSRSISVHETDIVSISAEVRYSTLIQLPRTESIVEVVCGDKEYWPVNWNANLAYVKPAKPGSKTNLNLITASGNVYSFALAEISGIAGAHADLRLFVSPAEGSSMNSAMAEKPRYVPAEAVEAYRHAVEQAERSAEQAKQELREKTAALQQKAEAEKQELQAALPGTIRHDYVYTVPAKANPFHITAIFHDDKFTYVEATPQEAPAIYEVKDGKPSIIQFELKAGRYIVPKILDDGYMKVGKASLTFHRES